MWPRRIETMQTGSEDYSQKYISIQNRSVLEQEESTAGSASLINNQYFLQLSSWGSVFISGATVINPPVTPLQEIPNLSTQLLLKQAEKDYANGNTSPAFETGEEGIAWLEKQGI